MNIQLFTKNPQTRAAYSALVKAEAKRRITEIVPIWKQINLTARAVELADKKTTGSLTQDDEKEMAAIRAIWEKVKAIRDFSNHLEEEPITTDFRRAKWPS